MRWLKVCRLAHCRTQESLECEARSMNQKEVSFMKRLAGFGVVAALALLAALGCGGHNSTMPSVSGDQTFAGPTRGGQPPSAPFIVVPRDGTVFVGMPVTFMLRATDPENDPLTYEIEVNGPISKTFTQKDNPTGWSWKYFGGYAWAIFKVQLPPGSYQWRARAHDGLNWGPYTNPTHSFSVR